MSEIVIDVTRLLSRGLEGRLPTGVDRVSLEYLRHFGERAKALVRIAGRWLVLNNTDSRRVFDELLAPGASFGWVIHWCICKGYLLGSVDHSRSVLFNTGHSGLEQADYAAQVRSRGLLPVFFLYDLIPITHPEYCRAGESAKHHQRLSTMLGEGRGLIVDSADTLDALERFAKQRALALPPCAVALLAPAPLPQPTSMRPLEDSYFVILGTIEPRKNHLFLLQVWRQLVEEFGTAAPRLVIIGQRGWECEQVVDLLERSDVLRTHVFEENSCSDAELANWLFHSRALLFPSFAEGFGMPMIEAFTLGVPVIASDLAVFREIAGNIPEYLDPLDGVGWRRAILDYTQARSPSRQAQCVRLQGFRVPTWSQHFEVVESLLERLAPSASVQ